MFNLKNLFTRALLALMLVTGAMVNATEALAGPTYHVTVNTAGYTGTGLIDFLLLGNDPTASTSAMLSNFSGDFGSDSFTEGDARGSIADGVFLGTQAWFNDFAQSVNLGGRFSFDLRFDQASESDPLTFSVGLYSDLLGTYLGDETGTLVQVDLTPGQPDVVYTDTTLANASEVPEPATLAAMMLGLTLMGSTLRARRRK
jgi:hypothetical protein